MSTGRFNLVFTGETTRLSAHIVRLQRQIDRLETKLKNVNQESTRNSKVQETALTKWAGRVGSVTAAYQLLTRAIDLANQAAMRREELQLGNAEIAARVGKAEAAMWTNLGVGASNAQRAEASAFVKEMATKYNMRPETVFGFAGGVASSTRGDLETMKKVIDAALPIARAFENPQAIGTLTGDLVDKGFTGPGARTFLLQLQQQAHTTSFPKLVYAMRSFVAGEATYGLEGINDPERRKQVIRETGAIYAAISQETKDIGGEMTGSGVSGALMTLYRDYKDQIKGMTPFEQLKWLQESGQAVRLTRDIRNLFGEVANKPATANLFVGGSVLKRAQAIMDEMDKLTEKQAADFIESQAMGVKGHRAPLVNQIVEGQEAAVERARSDMGLPSSILHGFRKYSELVQSIPGVAMEMGTHWWQRLRGEPTTPDEARKMFLSQVRRSAYAERSPIPAFGMALWGGAQVGARLEGFPTLQQMEQRAAMGLPPLPPHLFPPGTATGREVVIQEVLDNIRKWEEVQEKERAESSAVQPKAEPNASKTTRQMLRQNAASIQQNGATQQINRHTEPD